MRPTSWVCRAQLRFAELPPETTIERNPVQCLDVVREPGEDAHIAVVGNDTVLTSEVGAEPDEPKRGVSEDDSHGFGDVVEHDALP